MSMKNYGSSLRYDMNGRKRKMAKKSMSSPKVKARKSDFKPLKISQADLDRQALAQEHREKYPSLGNGIGTASVSADTSWKQEESKNFTIAPAYNKGAYQVITKNNIKDIGK